MLCRRVLAVVLVLVPFALLPSGVAAAVSPFGPWRPVVDEGCIPSPFSTGDLVVTSDGTTRGFVKVINCENPIWYVERSTGDWQHVATPYIGDVLSVATDGSNVYLLFRDYTEDEAVHVARRAPNGAFDPEQTLATNTRSSGSRAPVSGALLATNGTWWAVWSQDVGTNRELFQAKTFGTDQSTQRITINGSQDDSPALAWRPGGGGAVLAWSRTETPTSESSNLRLATSPDGAWSSRLLASVGTRNRAPDLFATTTTTHITWDRDDDTWVADDAGSGTATFTSRRLDRGSFPRITGSGAKVFVTYSRTDEFTATEHVLVGERVGATWSTEDVSQDVTLNQSHVAVSAQSGKATVLLHRDGQGTVPSLVYALTQT